ncbi:uncharacterized protein LOC116007477 isoform X3 [Ipomoea triloba]|nr:uncharacterized protein LOC116007477 isoform X3 [Ipomoea triloba]XP_031104050.1 uncharacterized protein LOC116007477 isoform X3 [Ipomoea triloba]
MVGPRAWIGGILSRSGIKRFGSDKFIDYILTPEEEESLHKLQERLGVAFDESRPDHQEALQALWNLTFPDVELKGLVSEQWKDMGWQGCNPATDFRGCGFLSLENLLFFARNYPDCFHRLLFKKIGTRATWEYPFAVAGINVSFMLIQMLELSSEKPKCRPGINFVKLLAAPAEDEEAFDVLYCIAFSLLDAQWLAMHASYMEFNEVLQVTRTQLERELSLEDIRKITDLPAFNLIVADQCADLTIEDEETGGLEAPYTDVVHVESWDLVGRFITDRNIKFDHMQQVMASTWRPLMGVRILSLDENLFLFQFPHVKDMQRVIDDGPWSFENNILVCKQVQLGIRPEDVGLDKVAFWVQVHDLPAIYASPEFIACIGGYVGTFISEDPNNFGHSRRSFYRIRVEMDVNVPLKRRMKLFRKDGSFQWLIFKYERLTTFCFCCGLLGHSDKFCHKAYEEGLSPREYLYDATMRVGARRQVQPVGQKWLLPDLPIKVSADKSSGSGTKDLVVLEEESSVHGDLKRRSEDGSKIDVVVIKDTVMSESSKNLHLACPSQ